MPFDPVRDAILNSPERVSYEVADPFDDVADDSSLQNGGKTRRGSNGSAIQVVDGSDDEAEEEFEAVDVGSSSRRSSSFKAPNNSSNTALGRRESDSSSYDERSGLHQSSRARSQPRLGVPTSPEWTTSPRGEHERQRPRTSSSASTSYFADGVHTPGGGTPGGGRGGLAGTVPPTPGSNGSMAVTPGGPGPMTPFGSFSNNDGKMGSASSSANARRQSSIFSLLSPDLPELKQDDANGGYGMEGKVEEDYFEQRGSGHAQGESKAIYGEPEELGAALPVKEDRPFPLAGLSPSKSAAEARRMTSGLPNKPVGGTANSVSTVSPKASTSSGSMAQPLSAHEQLKRRVLKPSSSASTSRPSSSNTNSVPSAIRKAPSPASPFPSSSASPASLPPKPEAIVEPPAQPKVWRRPYAPLTRINGPPSKSFYVPFTKREWEFYKDGLNSKNPLRSDAEIMRRRERQSPFPGEVQQDEFVASASDLKGKQREGSTAQAHSRPVSSAGPQAASLARANQIAQAAPLSAAEQHLTPAYAPMSPLHPSLIPDRIHREGIEPTAGVNGEIAGGDSRKRKRSNGVGNEELVPKPPLGRREGQEVAAHYNKRQNFSREERTFSPIIGLKSFNNWVKSVLIAKFARYDPASSASGAGESGGFTNGRNGNERGGRTRGAPIKVLDLGCGKGGDLMKWQKAGLSEYVGVDIADISIDQARDRWQQMRGPKFEASFYAFDCFSNPLSVIVPRETLTNRLFDCVTMQFCMHYAFQSVSKARMMLENVTRYLKKGGTFLGTIPDSEQLLPRLREMTENGADTSSALSFGNSVYQITFESTNAPSFGHRYTFFLTDAVENVPEYVVPWGEFEALAGEYGLKLLYHATFHELYEKESEVPEFQKLLGKMKVVNDQGESELTEEQWEACNIYVAFAFVRV